MFELGGVELERVYCIINIIFISVMKEITEDHWNITKDYESLFYGMKDQCKKNITFQHLGYSSENLPHLLPLLNLVFIWR